MFKRLIMSVSLMLALTSVSYAQLTRENIKVEPLNITPRVQPNFVSPIPNVGGTNYFVAFPDLNGLIGEEIPDEVFDEFEAVFGSTLVAPFRRQARDSEFNPAGRNRTLLLIYQPWLGTTFVDANRTDELKQMIEETGAPTFPNTFQLSEASLRNYGVDGIEEWNQIIQRKVDAGVPRADRIVGLGFLFRALKSKNPDATIEEVINAVGRDAPILTADGLPVNEAPIRGKDFDIDATPDNRARPNLLAKRPVITVEQWLKQRGLYLVRCIEPSQFTGRDEFGNPEIANDPAHDTEEVVRAETLTIVQDALPNTLYTIWGNEFATTEATVDIGLNRLGNRVQGGIPNVFHSTHDGLLAFRSTLRHCPSDCFLEIDPRPGREGRETSPTGSRLYRSILVTKYGQESFAFFSNLLGAGRESTGALVTTGPFLRQRGQCPPEGQSDQFVLPK